MAQVFDRIWKGFSAAARTAFLGPQILAFVPALTLGGYWFGGEGLLLFMAIFVPAVMGLVGLFSASDGGTRNRGAVDPITGLVLQSEVEAALDAAFAAEADGGLRSAAMVLEIDEFGDIKSTYGVEAAEQVLATIGERLTAALRQGDVVARGEGAQFSIALAPIGRLDLEAMIQIAGRLQDAVGAPMMLGGARIFVTSCIGFYLPRAGSGQKGSIALEAAEAALQEAQATGDGAIRAFSGDEPRKRVKRTGLAEELATALEAGHVRPWFQPQISTDTGEISGMEALARWEHPERGTILPGAFLPAISAGGLSKRLGEVILYHSLAALQDWQKAGCAVPNVSVNFSHEDLSDPSVCDRIRWELDRFNLAPERLVIEILETVISRSDNDTITRNIGQLQELGCGIDLDDFGTGHASIANIRRFSVSRIKIDRSFVSQVDSDREQQALLTAILEMAHRLDVETLAEGVETVGEHALLAQLGCGHVQGFLIARPMPFEDTLEWIEAYRRRMSLPPPISREAG